jgi:ATP-dependent Lon protease
LENLNYKAAVKVKQEEESENEVTTVAKEKIVLTTKQEILKDNQTGVSYKNLFGEYLKNASNITIQDPYIRLPYQFKNLLEFCLMLSQIKAPEDEINLEVVSWNHEEYLEDSKNNFEELQESVSSLGIHLTYRLEEHHDRYIAADNGWKITLGRGLDIFEKIEGRFNVADIDQTKRKCKSCELTFLKL